MPHSAEAIGRPVPPTPPADLAVELGATLGRHGLHAAAFFRTPFACFGATLAVVHVVILALRAAGLANFGTDMADLGRTTATDFLRGLLPTYAD